MEIQGTDGSKTRLKPGTTTQFGRGNGLNINDPSVSRRHISFDPINNQKVSFEVVGKNPIWVYNKLGDKKVKTLKRFDRGELGIGDLFCVSGKNPVWFSLKEVENGKRLELGKEVDVGLSKCLENDDGFDGNDEFEVDFVDVDGIDPVEEFDFLVIGHEFDRYPKKMIREIKNWDWFLDDPKVADSDEEGTTERRGKVSGRRKRKKSKGDDDVDEEWTAESEGEELRTNPSKVQKPKYRTRSKDQGVPSYRTKGRASVETSARNEEQDSEDEEDDEDDETLGGFIADDDTVEEDEDNEMDEDDEDEFVEDVDEDVED